MLGLNIEKQKIYNNTINHALQIPTFGCFFQSVSQTGDLFCFKKKVSIADVSSNSL